MKNSRIRWVGGACLSIALVMASGCDSGKTASNGGTNNTASGNSSAGNSATSGGTTAGTPAGTAGSTQPAGGVALTPTNASIGFIGTHVGKDPDPEARVGSFEKFTGTIDVDAAAKTVKSMSFEIDVASLKTAMAKLDDHLRTEDFLDVRNHPNAKFVLKELKPSTAGGEATHDLTGDLTVMGNTKPVAIPVKVEFAGDLGVKISGETKIKRSEFGLGKMLDKVNDEVTVKLSVGT